jgi:hypothetical protein
LMEPFVDFISYCMIIMNMELAEISPQLSMLYTKQGKN